MKALKLDQEWHVGSECVCRYVRSETEYFAPHCHDYYEIFMILDGNVRHVVNGSEQILCKGDLLFIRDFDVHTCQSSDGKRFELMNLTFKKETLFEMFDYLGNEELLRNLLELPFPPQVTLQKRDREKLFYSLTQLNESVDDKILRFKLRTLILNIFTTYFLEYTENRSEIPLWLEMLYERMKEPRNFIGGTDRMFEMCDKSREHLCRSLKRYYNLSPTDLVNKLRLEHCTNLLLTSNLKVTDICFECGFENIAWFYKLFEDKYHVTPAQYRKKYRV